MSALKSSSALSGPYKRISLQLIVFLPTWRDNARAFTEIPAPRCFISMIASARSAEFWRSSHYADSFFTLLAHGINDVHETLLTLLSLYSIQNL
jgi:hypothetical protein